MTAARAGRRDAAVTSHDVNRLAAMLSDLARGIEKAQVAEYVEFLRNPRRVIISNLLAGMARGLGFALGATLLAAAAVYLLSHVVELNLPVIGKVIAQLLDIVTAYRSGSGAS